MTNQNEPTSGFTNGHTWVIGDEHVLKQSDFLIYPRNRFDTGDGLKFVSLTEEQKAKIWELLEEHGRKLNALWDEYEEKLAEIEGE